MEITITLNDEEIKTALSALASSKYDLQAQANSLRPRAKRAGMTKGEWQRLADNADRLRRVIELAVSKQELADRAEVGA